MSTNSKKTSPSTYVNRATLNRHTADSMRLASRNRHQNRTNVGIAARPVTPSSPRSSLAPATTAPAVKPALTRGDIRFAELLPYGLRTYMRFVQCRARQTIVCDEDSPQFAADFRAWQQVVPIPRTKEVVVPTDEEMAQAEETAALRRYNEADAANVQSITQFYARLQDGKNEEVAAVTQEPAESVTMLPPAESVAMLPPASPERRPVSSLPLPMECAFDARSTDEPYPKELEDEEFEVSGRFRITPVPTRLRPGAPSRRLVFPTPIAVRPAPSLPAHSEPAPSLPAAVLPTSSLPSAPTLEEVTMLTESVTTDSGITMLPLPESLGFYRVRVGSDGVTYVERWA